jgi:hypothetical protein
MMRVAPPTEAPLLQRFRKHAKPEDGLPGFVRNFHLPSGLIFQIASDTPRHVGEHSPGFSPRRTIVRALRSTARILGLSALTDPE